MYFINFYGINRIRLGIIGFAYCAGRERIRLNMNLMDWSIEKALSTVKIWKEGDELMVQAIDPDEVSKKYKMKTEEILENVVSKDDGGAYEEEFISKFCMLMGLNEGAIRMMMKKPIKGTVPLWEKTLLTLEEAAAYSGIGINRLRTMTDERNCTFVCWNQSKRMIKRAKLDEYLSSAYSI